MSTTTRRLFALPVLLAWLLTACSPAAVSEFLPTEEAATVAPTGTKAPTATHQPTATITPSPIPPTETATPVPPTKTPRPTATATPGPGDVVYAPVFETDWKKWDYIYFGGEDFTLESDNETFTFNIDGEDTYVYSVYQGAFDYTDVQVDVDVTVVSGPNRNNLSIVCRYSDLGWYEFNILSGGLWTIYKYDETNGYRELRSGGSTAIKMGQNENHLTATCVGDTLTFFINDVKVGSAKDGAFLDGTFGMSASTFDIGKLKVRFRDFTVRLADPDAALGAAVAPTVAASSGDGGDGNGGDSGGNAMGTLFSFPLPGETVANENLQFDTLLTMSMLITLASPPGCQDVRVVWTEVTQITQPFVFDAQGVPTAGAWNERWTVRACDVESTYQVRYAISPAGGVDYAVSRLS